MSFSIGLLLFVQAAAATDFAAPAPPELYAAQSYAADLRRACMSEKGIAVATESWSGWLAGERQTRAKRDALVTELTLAAYTTPIDIDRLERAARARDADQARQLAESLTRSIAVMRKLSPSDRVIFARRLSLQQPMTPVKTCQP